MTMLQAIEGQIRQVLKQLPQVIDFVPGQIFVVGCSTSEVAGKRIGTSSSLDIAKVLHCNLAEFAEETGVYLAFQCCEHLNRALVVSSACRDSYGLVEVSAVPQPGAGGALPSVAYVRQPKPCLVESIAGHAGIDIGDTFIGMHLRAVAVPVRLDVRQIGEAHLTIARTRPKLIGGERAVYKQTEGVLRTCL